MTDQTVQARFARGRRGQQSPTNSSFQLVFASDHLTLDRETGRVTGSMKFRKTHKCVGYRIEKVPGRGTKIATIAVRRA